MGRDMPAFRVDAMTGAEFTAWRARLGLTSQAAADLLGLHIVTAQRYGWGRAPIPRSVELACGLLELLRAPNNDALRVLKRLRSDHAAQHVSEPDKRDPQKRARGADYKHRVEHGEPIAPLAAAVPHLVEHDPPPDNG